MHPASLNLPKMADGVTSAIRMGEALLIIKKKKGIVHLPDLVQ
jgi:hypothetical protein